MSEVISIHLGKAGIQMGNHCWQLFCLEHDIEFDGSLSLEQQASNDSINSVFYETVDKKMVPRSIFIDLEPDVMN
jgi:tubulin alpha